MADRKISDLTALTAPASGDYLPIVDISEAAAASKNKRITIEELFRGVPLGTAAAPSIAIEGDENTGIYSPGADQLAISTNGSNRLHIASDGKVGIGTTSPTATLHTEISSTGEVARFVNTNTTAGYGLYVKAGGSFGGRYSLKVDDASGVEHLKINQDGIVSIGNTATITNRVNIKAGSGQGPLLLENSSGVEVLRVDSSGRLGLGTSSPGGTLDVGAVSGAVVSGDLIVTTGSTTASVTVGRLSGTGSDNTTFNVRNRVGNSAFYVDTGNQRVGIGTTSPQALFHASGGNTTNFAVNGTTRGIRFDFDSTQSTIYGVDNTFFGSYQPLRIGGSITQLMYGGTEAARIDSSGRLLVGTSSNITGATCQFDGSNGRDVSISATRTAVDGPNSDPILDLVNKFNAVANNNGLGQLNFKGNSGTSTITAASIRGLADGTVTSTSVPGRLVFSTTADGASSPTERMRITSAGVVQIADAGNIAVGTTTGTKIGTATTQKLGFYNKTPVVQPTAVADATDAASVITQLNALLSRMRDLGLIAT